MHIAQTIPGSWDYSDEETITGLDTSQSLDADKCVAADAVVIAAFDQAVTVRLSNQAAGAKAGIPIPAGSYELFNVDPLTNIEIIEQAASATVHATYLNRKSATPD